MSLQLFAWGLPERNAKVQITVNKHRAHAARLLSPFPRSTPTEKLSGSVCNSNREACQTRCEAFKSNRPVPHPGELVRAIRPANSLEAEVEAIHIEEWSHFQQLASGSLEMLELLLKSRGTWQHVHAAVYCRSPESYATGELRFKLAKNMDLIGGASNTEVNSVLTLGGSPDFSDKDAQSFLLSHEVLELPLGGCSVFPLTRNQFVVGLLLLVLERTEDKKYVEDGSETDLEMWRNDLAVFLERDWDALEAVKKLLVNGCEMYQSAVLSKAASSAKSRFASGLLRETRGPVKTVRSMANMLMYRVEDGKPERDIVQNIQDQGARLSEVVRQLETAMHLPSHSHISPFSSHPIFPQKKQESDSKQADSSQLPEASLQLPLTKTPPEIGSGVLPDYEQN